MIHQQESLRFYAYCRCGVCGKPRKTREAAKADERAHAKVCAAKGKP